MRVAYLSFDFGEYNIRLASALAHDATVLLMLPHDLATHHLAKLDQRVRLQTFTKPRLRQPLRQMRMLKFLFHAIKQFRPHVIHLQGGHLWLNGMLPLLARYPLIVTIHNPRHHPGDKPSQKTPQRILDFGYHRAAQIIVHGHRLKQAVIDDLHISGEIVHVIPHIVLGDDTAQPHVQEEAHSILFFGRIWAYKGLEYLIRAEPLITAQIPEAKILIAGEGEDFSHFQRMMAHPEHFIIHNTYVSDDERAALFRRASIVVLPYIEASQSGVIPIAYTFAKPVIATTVGSLPEMVEDGHTGYLVPPRDEKALAEAIVRLLQNPDVRHTLGANGKRKLDTECAPAVVAQQTLDVYRRALATPPV
jgi:glycosyltransferase involved in cell wall biosynthesis